jgi:hypothetical protein
VPDWREENHNWGRKNDGDIRMDGYYCLRGQKWQSFLFVFVLFLFCFSGVG